MRTSISTLLAFTTFALARTDLEGCTSTDVSSPAGASVAWYVPGTGEVCEMLDCGGGRAPPKTTVPGCAGYVGTETYSPSYIAGYGASATAAPTATDSSSSTVDWSALETDSAASSWDLYTTLGQETGPVTITDASASPSSSVVAITDASNLPVTDASPSSSILTITDATILPVTDASSVVVISDASSAIESSTLVAQTTAAGGAYSNGTVSTGHSGSNGTVANGTTASPSVPVSDSGVVGSAQAWVGSAGLMMGLVGLVAVL
jgi:hypothetical protein